MSVGNQQFFSPGSDWFLQAMTNGETQAAGGWLLTDMKP
jgi:hypothetical protein